MVLSGCVLYVWVRRMLRVASTHTLVAPMTLGAVGRAVAAHSRARLAGAGVLFMDSATAAEGAFVVRMATVGRGAGNVVGRVRVLDAAVAAD